MSGIKFFVVDVFAEKKFGGNQLAVFRDLENKLEDRVMQAIAKEINFPETTFIKSNHANQRFKAKIYTPECEVPFAGHPSIGTSYIISKFITPRPQEKLTLELVHGDIEISVLQPDNLEHSALFMTQTQPEFGDLFTHNEIANDLGIAIDLIDTSMPIQEISTGLPYIIVPIKNLRAMERLTLKSDSLQQFLENKKKYKTNSKSGQSTAIYLFTNEAYEERNSFNARMFAIENDKIIEDAATGSAAGCLLAYLLKHVDKNTSGTLEQGFQMGRKSHLYLEGNRTDNRFHIKVGGRAKLISEGTWLV